MLIDLIVLVAGIWMLLVAVGLISLIVQAANKACRGVIDYRPQADGDSLLKRAILDAELQEMRKQRIVNLFNRLTHRS
jgi:hypothetical protein